MEAFTLLIDFATPAYAESLRLRDDLLRKPLGLTYDVEQLAEEYKDFHLACYNEDFELLGIMVLSPKKGGEIKMRQVAVKEAYQRQGIGQLMVRDCEVFVARKGYTKIVLNARDTAIPFYEKLAYKKVGKEFIEVSVKHFKMEKSVGLF